MMIRQLNARVDKISAQMKKLRRKLHRFPEPAYEEVRTAATIVEYLQDMKGMAIQTGVGTTGVVATLAGQKEGPCIALRADMDCLRLQEMNTFEHVSTQRGLMHGCGHDGHVACLVGAALVLQEMVEALPGPVKFIFQPAEENGAGAVEMIKGGALKVPVPRAIFGLHGTPSLQLGRIGLRSTPMMAASRYFTIRVTGCGTHAAMPHKGVDTVLAAAQIVCSAHTIVARNINPMEAAVISIPRFQGSTAPNVMPEEVVLEGTLRALSNSTRDFLEKRLAEVVEQTAGAFGAKATIDYYGGYPLLQNDPRCNDYAAEVAGKILGVDSACCDYPASLGSEDFAFYLEQVPGAFCWLGLGGKEEGDAPLHNSLFDFNDDALALGIRLHCGFALHGAALH